MVDCTYYYCYFQFESVTISDSCMPISFIHGEMSVPDSRIEVPVLYATLVASPPANLPSVLLMQPDDFIEEETVRDSFDSLATELDPSFEYASVDLFVPTVVGDGHNCGGFRAADLISNSQSIIGVLQSDTSSVPIDAVNGIIASSHAKLIERLERQTEDFVKKLEEQEARNKAATEALEDRMNRTYSAMEARLEGNCTALNTQLAKQQAEVSRLVHKVSELEVTIVELTDDYVCPFQDILRREVSTRVRKLLLSYLQKNAITVPQDEKGFVMWSDIISHLNASDIADFTRKMKEK